MPILCTNEILSSIKDELKNAQESVQIITAYCKESSFLELNDCIKSEITDKKLMIRFRMDDVIKGSTDFEVLEVALQSGWQVYVRFDLHAKTYIIDNLRGFIGSANLTGSGMGINRNPNMEMVALVELAPEDASKISGMFRDSIVMTNDLLDEMRNQLEEVESFGDGKALSWKKNITDLFSPTVDTLFSYEFPDSEMLSDGQYIPFLDMDYNGDDDKIKEAFRWSNSYVWLIGLLRENGGSMYFGEITEKLHNTIVSDPRPYRKDVKVLLSNLVSLIEKLDMPEIAVDRPNYSQRLSLR